MTATAPGIPARRAPSYGRGPNAAFFDRLIARETSRALWYPMPGAYLAWLRGARAALARGLHAKIHPDDFRGLDAVEFERRMTRALHERINAKGGNRYSRYNDPREVGTATDFCRDYRALSEFRRNRVRINGFLTRAVRDRFGHLIEPWE